MIYRFASLGSTNDEAQSEKYMSGDLVVAERQSAGRGQRGNKWLSGEGLNLTLSSIFLPQGLEASAQFVISQAAALALCDLLSARGLSPTIKWTNDIYIGERKIAGILIENRISGAHLTRSVVGIGLNVNQREFDPLLPNPTSMRVAAGASFDREQILTELEEALNRRFAQIATAPELIRSNYHALLYRRGELHPFLLEGREQLGKISGVAPSGALEVEWESGESGSYLFGQIEFVIESRKR